MPGLTLTSPALLPWASTARSVPVLLGEHGDFRALGHGLGSSPSPVELTAVSKKLSFCSGSAASHAPTEVCVVS